MNFQEKQTFWSWWMIILMLFLLLSTLNFDWTGIEQGNFNTISVNPGFWIIIGIFVLFSFIKLKTSIDAKGISIQFFPFIFKSRFIKWSEIDQLYVRNYNPISDYGGWGFRIGSNGRAYNTKGSVGLQLIFKDGSKLLIGTQKRDELNKVVTWVKEEFLRNGSE